MRMNDCKHWNGIQNETCRAGVNYRALAGEPLAGFVYRLPCHQFTTLLGKQRDPVACDQYRAVTAQEIREAEEQASQAFARLMTVLNGIAEWRNRPPIGKQEIIVCPSCGGRLHLAQAASSGHVHGRCETNGCVQWME
jgi:hypothetical protein